MRGVSVLCCCLRRRHRGAAASARKAVGTSKGWIFGQTDRVACGGKGVEASLPGSVKYSFVRGRRGGLCYAAPSRKLGALLLLMMSRMACLVVCGRLLGGRVRWAMIACRWSVVHEKRRARR